MSRRQVSELLTAWSARDEGARDALLPVLYEELRRLAHHYMRHERGGHLLQTTALVNEAYLRLAELDTMQWRERAHFFAMAATLMRRILVDHARARGRAKRGGAVMLTSIDDKDVPVETGTDVVALDDALKTLAGMDERQSQIVELRFFGGLTIEETADALDISPATVKREWATAKAWLHRELLRP